MNLSRSYTLFVFMVASSSAVSMSSPVPSPDEAPSHNGGSLRGSSYDGGSGAIDGRMSPGREGESWNRSLQNANQGLGENCVRYSQLDCRPGLSCDPGVGRCYHSPRREGEPCSGGASNGCGDGLTCDPGLRVCKQVGGGVGDGCHATRPCASGLTCVAGSFVCQAPGGIGDRCDIARPCASGLTCEAESEVCHQVPGGDGDGDDGDACHTTWIFGLPIKLPPWCH